MEVVTNRIVENLVLGCEATDEEKGFLVDYAKQHILDDHRALAAWAVKDILRRKIEKLKGSIIALAQSAREQGVKDKEQDNQ